MVLAIELGVIALAIESGVMVLMLLTSLLLVGEGWRVNCCCCRCWEMSDVVWIPLNPAFAPNVCADWSLRKARWVRGDGGACSSMAIGAGIAGIDSFVGLGMVDEG